MSNTEEVAEPEESQTTASLHAAIEEKPKLTFWLVYATLVCILGSSLQFGYNTSCINAPEQDIKTYFRKHGKYTDFEWSVAVAIFAIGGMIGAILGPLLADKFGRKTILLANNGLAILGAILMFISYFTKTSAVLTVGRLITGINNGIITVVAPIYLSELAPIKLRGSLGTLNQLGIVTGLLIGFIFGLKQVLGTAEGWPYLLGFCVLPSIFQLVTLPWCPRSPRYLLIGLNQELQAIEALKTLRGKEDVSPDINEMKIEQERENSEEHVSVLQLFMRRELQMPLLIGCVMMMSQQLGGINAVFYYSTSIFLRVGVPESRVATAGVGVIAVVFTTITVRLVEVLGRRTLMLIGLGGMFIFYTVMTIAFCLESSKGTEYVAVIATLTLVVFFMLGPGAIPWFITAELFSQGPRPAACAVAAVVNWTCNFIIGLVFPSLQAALYPFTFLVFMGLIAIFWSFTFFFVPETKGRTIEEITEHFRAGDSRCVLYRGIRGTRREINFV